MKVTLHTCVLPVELFEGTEEVRFVRKQLLPQDFEGRALGSPDAADKMTTYITDNYVLYNSGLW